MAPSPTMDCARRQRATAIERVQGNERGSSASCRRGKETAELSEAIELAACAP